MDLSTNYLGIRLRTPLVAAASPLSRTLDEVKRLEDAGAAAIVFHSVFEEQLRSKILASSSESWSNGSKETGINRSKTLRVW
jgi:dihydroorotate dehydrogenase